MTDLEEIDEVDLDELDKEDLKDPDNNEENNREYETTGEEKEKLILPPTMSTLFFVIESTPFESQSLCGAQSASVKAKTLPLDFKIPRLRAA